MNHNDWRQVLFVQYSNGLLLSTKLPDIDGTEGSVDFDTRSIYSLRQCRFRCFLELRGVYLLKNTASALFRTQWRRIWVPNTVSICLSVCRVDPSVFTPVSFWYFFLFLPWLVCKRNFKSGWQSWFQGFEIASKKHDKRGKSAENQLPHGSSSCDQL